MTVPLVVNGTTFNYPQQGNTNWGPTLTAWSTAVTNGMLQTSGINPANLIKSANSSPATAGFLRLSNGDAIDWRNFGNTANLALAVNSSDQLTFNGTPVATSGGGTVNPGTQFQVAYYATSTTAVSGLTLITANRALESDSNGLPIASGVSSTTLSYLDATSSVQTQFNTIDGSISSINAQLPLLAPKANPTFTGTVTIPNGTNPTDAAAFGQLSSYLPLAGGTMSGNIVMASNKVTGLANGTTSGDAVAYNQLTMPYLEVANITGGSIPGSGSAMTFPTTLTDTAGGWNGSSSYTIPSDGQYIINAYVAFNSPGDYIYLDMVSNGTHFRRGTVSAPMNASSFGGAELHLVDMFSAGNVVQIFLGYSGSFGSIRNGTAPYENYLQIQKVSN